MRVFLNAPSAADELDEQYNDGEHQQDVNVGSDGVEADETHKPQHEKDHKNRPKHFLLSVIVLDIHCCNHDQ